MQSFRDAVLKVVRAVPEGYVVTYGQVAAMIGRPRAARQVGMVLRGLKAEDAIPWQRVVNAQGGISTYRIGHGELQKALLEAEGVAFSKAGLIDLKTFRWVFDDGHKP